MRALYYYRDADQWETDLVLEIGRTIYPVKIKKAAKPLKRIESAFRLLEPVSEAGDMQIGDGAIINLYPDLMYLEEHVRAIPVGYL